MSRDLNGLRVLITGASRGVGKCLAEQAAAAGMRLALTARTADELAVVADALKARGAEAHAIPADITVPAQRFALVGEAVARLGGLDVLVNNAGIASHGHFATSTEDVMRQVMELNFFAAAEMTRTAMPHLMNGRTPAVVMVASLCGRIGLPAFPEHSASKFALVGLAEALRAEFVRFGVDVVTVLPGLIRGDRHRHQVRSEGRMKFNESRKITPEEAATGILTALRANSREKPLGSVARRMLLFYRFFPRIFDRLAARRVRKLYADDGSSSRLPSQNLTAS